MMGCLVPFGSYLPAHASKAAAPQPTADACLPDPGQVITIDEQVVPFFPARGKRTRGWGDLWPSQSKLGTEFHLISGNKAGGWSRPTKYGTPALEKYSPVWERGWLRLGVRSAVNWPSWWNRQHKHFISNTMDWLIFFTASKSPISYVFQTM